MNNSVSRTYTKGAYDLLVYSLLGSIVVMIIASQLFSITVPAFLYIAIFGIVFFLIDTRKIIALSAFVFVLDLWLPSYIVLFVAGVIYLLKKGSVIKLSKTILLFGLFYIFVFIGSLVNGQDSTVIIKGFGMVLSVLILFTSIDDAETCKSFSEYYLFGFVLLAVLTIAIAAKYIGFEVILRYRLGANQLLRLLPTNVLLPNENNLARNGTIAIALCLLLRQYKHISSISYYSILLVSLITILLTKSRTGIILTGITLFLFVFANRKNNKHAGTILSVIVIVFVTYFVIERFMPNVLDSLMLRFSESDISNGRIDIMTQYHRLWTSNSRWILFGVGQDFAYQQYGLTSSVHNAYQAIFVYYGIIGGLFFCMFYINYLTMMIKKYKNILDYKALIPLFVILISKFGGSYNIIEFLIAGAFISITMLSDKNVIEY